MRPWSSRHSVWVEIFVKLFSVLDCCTSLSVALEMSGGIGNDDNAGRFIVMFELERELNFWRALVNDSDCLRGTPSTLVVVRDSQLRC